MKCWHCNTELIWGGDHDIDDENDHFYMETNLSCPGCDCFVVIYYPKDNEDESEDSNGKYQNEKNSNN